MTAAQAREITRLQVQVRTLEEALTAQKTYLGDALDREAALTALLAKQRE